MMSKQVRMSLTATGGMGITLGFCSAIQRFLSSQGLVQPLEEKLWFGALILR